MNGFRRPNLNPGALVFDPSILEAYQDKQAEEKLNKFYKDMLARSPLFGKTIMNPTTDPTYLDHGALPTRVEQITAPRLSVTKQLHCLIDLVKHHDDLAADLKKQADELKVKYDESISQAKKARAELLKTHGVKL